MERYIDRIVEVPLEIEQERTVYVDRIVEKVQEVERPVETIVEVERRLLVEVPIYY